MYIIGYVDRNQVSDTAQIGTCFVVVPGIAYCKFVIFSARKILRKQKENYFIYSNCCFALWS